MIFDTVTAVQKGHIFRIDRNFFLLPALGAQQVSFLFCCLSPGQDAQIFLTAKFQWKGKQIATFNHACSSGWKKAYCEEGKEMENDSSTKKQEFVLGQFPVECLAKLVASFEVSKGM